MPPSVVPWPRSAQVVLSPPEVVPLSVGSTRVPTGRRCPSTSMRVDKQGSSQKRAKVPTPTKAPPAEAPRAPQKMTRGEGALALGEDVETFFVTFASNLADEMSATCRDIWLPLQRHSRHVVTFAYRPVGR